METGKPVDFEECTAEDLALTLRQFYADVRTKKGEKYSRAGFVSIRSAINRHTRFPPYVRTIDIIKDKEFHAANQVYSGCLKTVREEGLDIVHHKMPISSDDMEKMYSSGTLSNDNPKSLQYKVFVELSLHFGRRGREGFRELKKSSFDVKTDSNGVEYVVQTYIEKEKKSSRRCRQ